MEALEVLPTDYHERLVFNKDDIFDPNSYLSKSVLWSSYGVSLWHWKHKIEPYQSGAMHWGSVIDILTTTPEEASKLIVRKEDCPYLSNGAYRTKKAQQWRDDHIDAGHHILTAEDYDRAHQYAKILLEAHPVSSEIFAESKKQVILLGQTKSGIKLKGLADLVGPGKYLADLKTTSDFSMDEFSKTIAKYGYHVQAGMYLILWNQMHPEDQRKNFYFIWQSSQTGEVAVTELCYDDILAGQAMTRYLISKLEHAYKTNHFPMITENDKPVISRPMWASMADDELLTINQ